MTKVVVDASVLIAVASNEPIKADLVQLTQNVDLIAPSSVHWEIGNAFSAMLKRVVSQGFFYSFLADLALLFSFIFVRQILAFLLSLSSPKRFITESVNLASNNSSLEPRISTRFIVALSL